MQLILSKDNKSSYRRVHRSYYLCRPDSFIWQQSVSQKSNGFVCETIIFLYIWKRGTLIAEQRIYVSGSNAP